MQGGTCILGRESNPIDLKVNLGKTELKNPVIAASGTFGFGYCFAEYIDIERLGAIATKGITIHPRQGNPPPRIHEVNCGILNSIGLQNPGIDKFIKEELPKIKEYDTFVIVNIAGETLEEFEYLAKRLDIPEVDAIELNVSCPNVKQGGMIFGKDPLMIAKITKSVRKSTDKPIIVKLTPNTADIKECAKAAEENGADAISLINTIPGMAIDIYRKCPIFENVFAGLSGPAIKPIALRMVYETARTVKIPVIGMGGITTAEDAIEFLMAGASAIAIGTGNLISPDCPIKVLKGIKDFLLQEGYKSISEIINIINKRSE